MFGEVAQKLGKVELEPELKDAGKLLHAFVDPESYVGEVFSLGYETALVQIHDFFRQQVGGIPALSFLIATRITPAAVVDVRQEDASIVLLRVLDHADLPNAQEAFRVRVENAQRVSGELEKTWDDKEVMDPTTHNLLSYAGVSAASLAHFLYRRILAENKKYVLTFGSDLSNYYPNRGLKVFKPRGEILKQIVNYLDPRLGEAGPQIRVQIGHVRNASTNRPFQKIAGVSVAVSPIDLLAQKTALFGMTRTGKSNTTKIVLKSIFELRWHPSAEKGGVLPTELGKSFSIQMENMRMRMLRMPTITKTQMH